MRTPSWRDIGPLAAILVLGAAASLAPSVLAARPDAPVPPSPYARGRRAVDRLGARLPEVARGYGLNPGELRTMLLTDDTLAVDAIEQLAYFDVLAPGETAAADPAPAGPASAPPVTGPEFQLSSLPGADKTIYLDFDGHVTQGTTWNSAYGVATITSPPYDTNGDPDTWSAAELQVIRDSWAVVAEDFAPWNVNVTTIDPGVEALRYSGGGDSQWGARVVVTRDTFANCGCGGHAYIGAFDDSTDEPTFVYNTSFRGVSEAISHEVGHMLNLAHDGTTTASYYTGHDTADTPGWAPIMGAAYYQPVTQWSQQEYVGADNTGSSANYGNGADDIAIISSLTNGNGFGPKADDHGDTLATATPLTGQQVSQAGVIGSRSDVDVFSFTTDGGGVSFVADNAPTGPNLDIALTLRDGSGAVVASDNPVDGLDAGLDAQLAAGTYSIQVEGVGVGTPGVSPPSGYTDYGSIGRYTLLGYVGGIEPPDTTPPSPPTGLQGEEVGGTAVLGWNANGETDLAGYVVRRAPSPGGPYTDLVTVDQGTTSFTDVTAPGGSNSYRIAAVDASGNVSGESDTVTVEIPVDLTSVATGETNVAGTVSGTYLATQARDGQVQTVTEVDSGGKPSSRHDLAEHRWAIPASAGNQALVFAGSATDGGDADDGFIVEWSDDGTVWIPVVPVPAGTQVDVTVYIGAPSGTVWVRVVDTDRSRGERGHDSIAVDVVQIVGDGNSVEPPTASMVVAAITVSQQGAGKGLQYGVATVQVHDDLGNPVAGASVTVQFGGSFTDRPTGTTGSGGSVTFLTSTSARKPDVQACVVTVVAGGLTYQPGTEHCP